MTLLHCKSILKELGIIQSGGAIKAFLQEKEVFVNGELEQRRGRKLRVNDQINIPELSMTITILEPSQEEIEEHLKEKEEKERVAELVKQLNQQQKKTNRQRLTKKKKQFAFLVSPNVVKTVIHSTFS